jgi:hypothetical protein
LVYGCQNHRSRVRLHRRPRSHMKLFIAKLLLRGEESRRRRKSRTPAGGVRNTAQGRPGSVFQKKAGPGSEEELSQSNFPGHRMCDRRSKGRRKSSASLVERRRFGPKKSSSSHGGEVESVLASFIESENRAPRKRHAPVSLKVATEASEARSSRAWVRNNTPPQCEGDPLKRSRAS